MEDVLQHEKHQPQQRTGMTGAQLVRYFEALKTIRQPLENHIRQCYQYTHPIRGLQFNGGQDQTPESVQQQAAAIQAALTDATAGDACNVLASTLVSGLTPANSLWIGISAGDDAPGDVKKWLDEKSVSIHKGIHASNYDAPAFEAMLDEVISGMCALYIEEGDETDYTFEVWPLHSCWFASTRKGGGVDTAVRYFTLTAQQAVREYGSRCPEKIRESCAKDPYKRHPFIHFIMPKQFAEGAPKKVKDELLPFHSYHVSLETKTICRSGGYSEFPVAVPRWLKLPDSVYATGPMSTALPDVKTLNEIERIVLANAEMQMSGMWGATDDGVLNVKTVKIGPRKLIFMAKKDSFFSLTPPGNIQVGTIEAEKKRAQIRRILMADQLEPMAAGPAKTATEVHYRINLIRQLLGPMFGRLMAEYIQTVVFRCFGITLRKELKAGKTIPEALRKKTLRLRYINPLARAQQLEDVAAMDRYEQGLLAKAEARPEVLDVYDWEEAERKRGEYLGVPSVLILPKDKVKELRTVREDRQAKEAQNLAMAEARKKAPAATGGEMTTMAGALSPAALGGLNV